MRKAKAAIVIALFYAAHPRRVGELWRWIMHWRSSTFDLAQPWWNFPAIESVESALAPASSVLEFGGGGSTLWLAARGARVTVVEHDAEWAEVLRSELPDGCTVVEVPPSDTGTIPSMMMPSKYFDEYVATVDRLPDRSQALIVVDGRARVECVRRALPKVAEGGMLVLDDSDRKRYAAVHDYFGPEWEREDFRGVKIGGGISMAQTSVWHRRPSTSSVELE